jgi:hypothetical protein
LKEIVDNQISVVTVVSDRSIKSSEEAQKIIRMLTSAAVQQNYHEIVRELGEAEELGSSLPNPYSNVPEVRPVVVTTVSFSVLASCHIIDVVLAYLECGRHFIRNNKDRGSF